MLVKSLYYKLTECDNFQMYDSLLQSVKDYYSSRTNAPTEEEIESVFDDEFQNMSVRLNTKFDSCILLNKCFKFKGLILVSSG